MRLWSPTAREILIIIVQAGPVSGKFFVAAALHFFEEAAGTLRHFPAFTETFARVFAVDATFHERLVFLVAVGAVVMSGSHQHGRCHI